MDSVLTWGVSLVSLASMYALARKLNIFQEWIKIQASIRNSLADRRGLLVGILAGLVYAVVFLVFGGQGGRVHYFYSRWIFNLTLADTVVGLVAMVLVVIAMAMFVYSWRLMGLQTARKGGLGFVGTLLALLAAFCP